jgi:hypothetical protein
VVNVKPGSNLVRTVIHMLACGRYGVQSAAGHGQWELRIVGFIRMVLRMLE